MDMTNSIATLEAEEIKVSSPSAQELRKMIETFVSLIPNIKDSSRIQYTKDLSQFFEWTKETGRDLSSLTQIDIISFQTYLEKRGLSPLTISSYLISVRKFFEWTEANKIYPNIAKGVKGPQRKKKIQKRALLDSQSRDLLEYFSTRSLRDYAIVNLCLRTGLRTIEVVRANIGDMDYRGGRRVLKVWGKGKLVGDKEEDFVVLSDKAFAPLQEYLKTRKGATPDEPLFVTNRGRKRASIEGDSLERYDGEKNFERLTTRSISKICKEGLEAIGLTGHSYTAHSLRHTCGCSIIRQKGSLQDVQFVLRHSSSKTSEIYLESIKEEQRLERAPELLLDSAF